MNYYNKYLKYKNKYLELNLNKQYGGSSIANYIVDDTRGNYIVKIIFRTMGGEELYSLKISEPFTDTTREIFDNCKDLSDFTLTEKQDIIEKFTVTITEENMILVIKHLTTKSTEPFKLIKQDGQELKSGDILHGKNNYITVVQHKFPIYPLKFSFLNIAKNKLIATTNSNGKSLIALNIWGDIIRPDSDVLTIADIADIYTPKIYSSTNSGYFLVTFTKDFEEDKIADVKIMQDSEYGIRVEPAKQLSEEKKILLIGAVSINKIIFTSEHIAVLTSEGKIFIHSQDIYTRDNIKSNIDNIYLCAQNCFIIKDKTGNFFGIRLVKMDTNFWLEFPISIPEIMKKIHTEDEDEYEYKFFNICVLANKKVFFFDNKSTSENNHKRIDSAFIPSIDDVITYELTQDVKEIYTTFYNTYYGVLKTNNKLILWGKKNPGFSKRFFLQVDATATEIHPLANYFLGYNSDTLEIIIWNITEGLTHIKNFCLTKKVKKIYTSHFAVLVYYDDGTLEWWGYYAPDVSFQEKKPGDEGNTSTQWWGNYTGNYTSISLKQICISEVKDRFVLLTDDNNVLVIDRKSTIVKFKNLKSDVVKIYSNGNGNNIFAADFAAIKNDASIIVF